MLSLVRPQWILFEAKRSWTIYNWLQYFSLEVLRREFSESGFFIKETYADTAGAPYHEDAAEIAVVAMKRN